jgi:hypothetical protein
VEGTRSVLQACRSAGIQRYVHMSALGSRRTRSPLSPQVAGRRTRPPKRLQWTILRLTTAGVTMRMIKFFCTSLRQPVMPYFGSGSASAAGQRSRRGHALWPPSRNRTPSARRTTLAGGSIYLEGTLRSVPRPSWPSPTQMPSVFLARLMARTSCR